jgi:hypothetical protein
MSCKKIWSREFVMEHFTNKWVKQEFLSHVGCIVREQEKGLLPSSQHEASLILNIRKLSDELQNIPTNAKIEREYKSCPELKELRLVEKRQKWNMIHMKIHELKDQTVTYTGNVKQMRSNKVSYIMKCPFDECRGYISQDGTCGTCSNTICTVCLMPKDDEHMCNRENIESAQAIQRDTKPCPQCMTPIFKASGCNQMFCTQCNTAFDWITKKIETGMVHNPHFYEWLASRRTQNMDIDNIACGDMPDAYTFANHVNAMFMGIPGLYNHKLLEMYRMVHHIRGALLPLFQVDRVKDNFDLRVGFLLNDFDEDVWAMKLMNREKKRMKNKAVYDLLSMITVIIEDMVRRVMVCSARDDKLKCVSILNEYEKLKEFYDENLDKILNVHGGSISRNVVMALDT